METYEINYLTVVIGENVTVGKSIVVIMANAVVNVDAKIGKNESLIQ